MAIVTHFFRKLNPKNENMLSKGMSILKFLVRVNAPAAYPMHWQTMESHADVVLGFGRSARRFQPMTDELYLVTENLEIIGISFALKSVNSYFQASSGEFGV